MMMPPESPQPPEEMVAKLAALSAFVIARMFYLPIVMFLLSFELQILLSHQGTRPFAIVFSQRIATLAAMATLAVRLRTSGCDRI